MIMMIVVMLKSLYLYDANTKQGPRAVLFDAR